MKIKVMVLLVASAVVVAGAGIWLTGRHGGQPATTQKQAPALSIALNVPEGSLLLPRERTPLQVAIKTARYADFARVDYLLDGKFATYSTTPPFTVQVDLSGLNSGEHTLQALARTLNGHTIKSEIFTFRIEEGKPVEPADQGSQTIVRRSASIKSLLQSSNSGSSSGSNEPNNGGGPGNTTPWPDTPPAQICGNSSLLSGLSTAPAGAVVVPAGSNNGFNFANANTAYWFAPGSHTLGTDPLDQIVPGDNATFVGAPGAILDGQGTNKYAFTQHATNVKIQYLTITNFKTPKNEGTVNHDSGVGWTIEYNTVQNNKGGAVFAGSNNVVRYNCLKDNGQYGFQVFSSDAGGPHDVQLDHNEIVGNNSDDWETVDPGCGCTGGGKFWDAHTVTVSNNYVHDNLSVGLWADTNDTDFLVEGNYIKGNHSQGLFYEISYNMIVRNNNFIGNGVTAGPGNPSFPTGAIYLSEAGGDNRVAGRTSNIEIYDNQFSDNWAGVVLWENADRFCGSPANTSGGTCTLGNPGATLTTCNDPGAGGSINVAPYYSDCRWKTQNVKVHNNIFSSTKANIPNCTLASSCGFQGLFSNIGTFPSWSPYMGSVIQTAITFNQNNVFSSNTYLGDWSFMAKTQGSKLNFSVWQAAPYGQDVGSTYNGQSHLTVANALDEDTATLEGSIGNWIDWFSETISQSTAEAHSGTHSLKVAITAPFGWGVQLSNPNGFPITPTPKTVSFWGKLGVGTGLGATLQVVWLDANQAQVGLIQSVPLALLTTSWQQATVPLTPPANTATAVVRFVSSTGSAGNSLYLDDIVVADN